MREQYSSYDECVAFFTAAQKTHPHIFKVESIGKTWEDRDIVAITLSNDMEFADEKPALFYTGSIHAREWIGIELGLAFGKYVLEYIDYDPQLKSFLSRATMYLVPCANPDGFEYSRNHFAFWRKNRRQNADGSFGVDLNRNFSVGFTPNKNTTSNVYSGPAAFSEPETLALKNFTEDHSNITIALDYHSQGNVIFPAHNFIHEDDLEATDLNVLSANMAEEIRKYSGREYGVHMGKPPVHLISGSGREFYYAQGALSLVVEVGSRNISDYKENMSENINENIPALMHALSEAPNYDKTNKLPRVDNFIASRAEAKEIELTWEYPIHETVYFEIYRSKKEKGFCESDNRVGITKSLSFVDKHIDSATTYFYFIRAVCKKRYIKSPFAPVIAVRTNPEFNMFAKILYPTKEQVGYVGEKTQKNGEHFGENSLFVGVSNSKGECYGVTTFSLDTIPENAIITSAFISYYPMNRVSVQVERFGEWRVGMMDSDSVSNLSSFTEVKEAKMLGYVGKPTKSQQLSQGIWRTYQFAEQERALLMNALKRRSITFRMEGPKVLPEDRASQLMQWDIGYGKFSGGLSFRPKLDISYTLNEAHLEVQSFREVSIAKNKTTEGTLLSGFDNNGDTIYGCVEFDLSQMPDLDTTIIASCSLELEALNINSANNLRYHVEMVQVNKGEKSYDAIKRRDVIERLGYDMSIEVIKDDKNQKLIFDSHALQEMVEITQAGEKLLLVIHATSEKSFNKSQSVEWVDKKRVHRPKLVMSYIKKRRNALESVKNLKYTLDEGLIKLTWDNPKDEDFAGVVVVKNPFHIPCSPFDGQKLFGGKDSYTYDNFGDKGTSKYYAVFAYDNVPNYSEPAVVQYLKK